MHVSISSFVRGKQNNIAALAAHFLFFAASFIKFGSESYNAAAASNVFSSFVLDRLGFFETAAASCRVACDLTYSCYVLNAGGQA